MANIAELYYANWCGHCKTFKPIWFNEIKPIFAQRNIKCYEYNDELNADKIEAAGIDGFPTIILTRNGIRTQYNGPRTSNAIISFFGQSPTQPLVEMNGGYLNLNLDDDVDMVGGGGHFDDDKDDVNEADEEYYKMKYYKYKAKYLKLAAKHGN
jgi:thiol-disulfide isomerase/thioredoxin